MRQSSGVPVVASERARLYASLYRRLAALAFVCSLRLHSPSSPRFVPDSGSASAVHLHISRVNTLQRRSMLTNRNVDDSLQSLHDRAALAIIFREYRQIFGRSASSLPRVTSFASNEQAFAGRLTISCVDLNAARKPFPRVMCLAEFNELVHTHFSLLSFSLSSISFKITEKKTFENISFSRFYASRSRKYSAFLAGVTSCHDENYFISKIHAESPSPCD